MKVYGTLGAVLLLVSAALTLPVGDRDLDSMFQAWKKLHEKVYSGAEEEAQRRSIWEETLKLVEKHNEEAKQGLHSFMMGMTQFADKTKEERQKGCLLPPLEDVVIEIKLTNVTAEPETTGGNNVTTVELQEEKGVKWHPL